LFNIAKDPCEYRNVADKYPQIVAAMWKKLTKITAKAVPARNRPHDPEANPARRGYVWGPWR
jgi:hypothetical protein